MVCACGESVCGVVWEYGVQRACTAGKRAACADVRECVLRPQTTTREPSVNGCARECGAEGSDCRILTKWGGEREEERDRGFFGGKSILVGAMRLCSCVCWSVREYVCVCVCV